MTGRRQALSQSYTADAAEAAASGRVYLLLRVGVCGTLTTASRPIAAGIISCRSTTENNSQPSGSLTALARRRSGLLASAAATPSTAASGISRRARASTRSCAPPARRSRAATGTTQRRSELADEGLFDPLVEEVEEHGVEVDDEDSPRMQAVARAVKAWTDQLIDRSARNNLLFFRDQRAGTLDLTKAPPRPVFDILAGRRGTSRSFSRPTRTRWPTRRAAAARSTTRPRRSTRSAASTRCTSRAASRLGTTSTAPRSPPHRYCSRLRH